MSIVFDLIVILIVALFTFWGYKQGLVKAAIKILSFFIAIIITLVIYKPVSGAIVQNTSIDDKIKDVIIDKIGAGNTDDNQEVKIKENFGTKILGEVNNTIEGIASAFSVKLVEIGTLLILFILLNIVLRIIMMLTDLITKIPVVKQINKLRAERYMDL